MHKEHNGAAPVQKSCNMCLFTSHLSHVLKNHINRKHLDTLKMFECNKCDFSAKRKGVLKHHKHLKHKKTNSCRLCVKQTTHEMYVDSDSLFNLSRPVV